MLLHAATILMMMPARHSHALFTLLTLPPPFAARFTPAAYCRARRYVLFSLDIFSCRDERFFAADAAALRERCAITA